MFEFYFGLTHVIEFLTQFVLLEFGIYKYMESYFVLFAASSYHNLLICKKVKSNCLR